MKKYIICLGLGKNQLKLLKEIDTSFGIIGIDISFSDYAKDIVDIYYKGSLYNINDIKLISKKIKAKKYDIEFILYRSSGPTILSAHYLEQYFKIKRINHQLSKCIYSKSFFYKYLKSIGLPGLKSKTVKKLKSFSGIVIKPDAPIYGKKNIFLLNKKNSFLFKKCQKESHNNKVNISNFYQGSDISSFYIKEKKSKLISLISHTQEFNFFRKNVIKTFGSCSPPIDITNEIIKKKEIVDKSIIKSFKDFYGVISITSKIKNIKVICPYEINIGLSGDNYADLIFPFNFNNRSLYKIDLDICLNNKKIKLSKNKKFIGLFRGQKITSKNYFKKKISNIN